MNLQVHIEKAINLLLLHGNSEEDLILEYLLRTDVEESVAIDLLTYVPVVATSLLFADLNVSFPDFYREQYIAGGELSEFLLCEHPIYTAIFNYESVHKKLNLNRDELTIIAGRSAEFDGIKQAMDNNANLDRLRVEPTVLIWHELFSLAG